jgi:hypothetical protein
MRKINLLWLIGIFMLIPISFTSCSGDEDKEKEESGSTSMLLGTWEYVYSYSLIKENGVIYDEETLYEPIKWRFNADGTFETNDYDDGWENDGTWSYKKGELTMIGDKGKATYPVTLTKSKLVLEATTEYTEDGNFYEVYNLLELRKISD